MNGNRSLINTITSLTPPLTLLDKSKEVAIDKSKEFAVEKGGGLIRGFLRLDEKEQIRPLEQALKNATERGIAKFHTLEERDHYRSILETLSQEGPDSEALRRQALQLFTLSDTPDFTTLNEKYNYRQRLSALAQKQPYTDIDTTTYLTSFFDALIAELYADPYFRPQLSIVLQLPAAMNMQKSLMAVVALLHEMKETLADNYLGKLKPKHVTNLLRQILQGKIKSRRCQYTDVIQQDLFFVCDCLIDEIVVENELAELVVLHLSDVVKNLPFPLQREEALDYPGKLMQTRQYTTLGQKALVNFVSRDEVLDIVTKTVAAEKLYQYSSDDSDERRLVTQRLSALVQRPDLSFEQIFQATEGRQQASWGGDSFITQVLLVLTQRSDLSFEQTLQVALTLHQRSPINSDEQRLVAQMLLAIVQQHPDSI